MALSHRLSYTKTGHCSNTFRPIHTEAIGLNRIISIEETRNINTVVFVYRKPERITHKAVKLTLKELCF